MKDVDILHTSDYSTLGVDGIKNKVAEHKMQDMSIMECMQYVQRNKIVLELKCKHLI